MVRFLIVMVGAVCPLQAEWQSIGPFGGPIQTVATDPHHASVVIAASATATLFQSRDAGASWTLLHFPAESRAELHTVRFDPVRPEIVYVALTSELGERAGVYRSTDSGASWQQVPAMRGQQVWSLEASSQGEIAAGTESGIYLSHDGGDTWRMISPSGETRIRPVVSLAFDPNRAGVLYVGTPHLAWKATGLGAVWTAAHEGMSEDSDIFSIAADQATPGRIFASACSGLYVSQNGGNTWSRVPVPNGIDSRTYFVASHPGRPSHVYAGTVSGVIRSVDGGTHWRTISARTARAIAFDTLTPGRLYIATDTGILRSDDAGIHLTAANVGLSTWRLSRLTESEGAIYAGLPESAAPPQLVVRPDAKPRPASTGTYALAGGEALHSPDFGRIWTHLQIPAHANALVAFREGVLLIACGSAIFRTSDGGRTWLRIDTPILHSAVREIVSLGGHSVAAYADAEVLWSPDGIRWMAPGALPGDRQIRGLTGDSSGLLLAATSSGLIRSSDFGRSWSAVEGELGAMSIEAVTRDPANPEAFVTAAFGLVYRSLDGGLTWQRLDIGGSPIGGIRHLLITADPHRLFALTEEHGSFAWDIGVSPALK
jgi:photosystem II stability/assembly factor-like uncharacterized protein